MKLVAFIAIYGLFLVTIWALPTLQFFGALMCYYVVFAIGVFFDK